MDGKILTIENSKAEDLNPREYPEYVLAHLGSSTTTGLTPGKAAQTLRESKQAT